MDVSVEPGKYVVAVSGGVDSVALLHALTQRPGLDLVVAHFDHGIRSDSAEDALFVSERAKQYQLPFESQRVELGPGASENTARRARYTFLKQVQLQHQAAAIITAHHQDDLLETAILNMLRGTGRRGLTSLSNNEMLRRPLLHLPKQAIIGYALKHKLSWREDTTNHDERYTRNYIRHRLLGNSDIATRQQLLALIGNLQAVNTSLDAQLAELLLAHDNSGKLDATWLKSLPHDVACEVMAGWLRRHNIADYDRPTIERLVVQAKTKPAGKRLDVRHGVNMVVEGRSLALELAER